MTWFYRFATALSLLTLWAGAGSARADQLWYNGDYDGNSEGIPNGVFQSGQTAYVYDDFIIPAGQTWNITSVYSNNLMNDPTATSSAYVQILSGVVANVGGTSLYMGTDTATQTPTGRTDPIFDTPEYTIAASGLNVTLGPGTYWLTVSPVLLMLPTFRTSRPPAGPMRSECRPVTTTTHTSTARTIRRNPTRVSIPPPATSATPRPTSRWA